ncbi:MAG: FAD-binding oxidoreductase, partial [Nonomuraea sp.]|nr:FAD-binding oxidoreductase [Nonomuraea sp.]
GRHCPILRPGWASRAMLKSGAMDIDVDALHQGFLRGIRARGGQVVTGARVRRLSREGGVWRAVTEAGEFTAPTVVNAAGAWADEVAALAGVRRIGLRSLRRTAFLVEGPPEGPLLTDVADTFYVKPESGALLVSPADATPVPPCDARPDDLDVARGIERVRQATTLPIRSVRHAWAGLRSVVADDTPVIGQAEGGPGFVWLADLGGYGVQTAPEVTRIAAAAALGEPPGPDLAPERI